MDNLKGVRVVQEEAQGAKNFHTKYPQGRGKIHSEEFTLDRGRCPGKQTWERLERMASSTWGQEWIRKLAEPRQ